MKSFTNQILTFTLIVSTLTMSGCATIFAARNQKVEISKGQKVKLTVNGERAKVKNRKYIIDKKPRVAQITASKEGYKSENIVIGTYKTHPLKYLSAALAVPFYFVWVFDKGPKARMYDKTLEIGKNLVKYPVREADDKAIQLNVVSAEIDAKDIKVRNFGNFRKYYRKEDKLSSKEVENMKKIDVENTIFTSLFNTILKKSGFIDTTDKVLKNSYTNNLLLNAKLTGITFHRVGITQMVYSDITIDWEVLDFYKKPIYSATTTTTSGQFTNTEKAVTYMNAQPVLNELVNKSIEDGMEFGLLEFLSKDEVKSLLKDNSAEETEKLFTEIILPKGNTVKTISDGIKASVTIKSKDGHGSGFIISPEGHIITNYHVISEKEDLSVVTNDGTEYEVEIIRESKINDLALIKIKAKSLLHFTFDQSKDINIGEVIYAIGTPESKSLSQTVSKGIISGERDSGFGTKLIQTDVSINSGNSGGALVNKSGVVIGVVSSKLTGFGVEGVAFGIPAYEIFDKLKIK